MIFLNGSAIVPTIFPDKTSQVWQIDPKVLDAGSDVLWEFEGENEFFHLAQLAMLLRVKYGPKLGTLDMPFLPYGRQDKDISNEKSFAFHSFAQIVDRFCFSKIVTLDAHNADVFSKAFATDTENIFPENEINFAIENSRPTVIAYPDAGAVYRYGEFLRWPNTVQGNKKRDAATGRVSFEGFNGTLKKYDSVLMIDDICDGGATFCEMSKMLLEAGAKSVDLYTTHGIYSKGVGVLMEAGIQRIFNREGEIE